MEINSFLGIISAIAPFLATFIFYRVVSKADKAKEKIDILEKEKVQNTFMQMNEGIQRMDKNVEKLIIQMEESNTMHHDRDKDVAVLSQKVDSLDKRVVKLEGVK